MKRLVIFSEDARVEQRCASFLPPDWKMEAARNAEQASLLLEAPPPGLLLIDGNPAGMPALDFLKMVLDERGIIPPVILAVDGDLGEEQAADLAKLGVAKLLSRPVTAPDLELNIAPYFVPPLIQQELFGELLASSLWEPSRRYVTFDCAGIGFGLLLGGGCVESLVHPSFRDIWRRRLEEAGFSLPEARDNLLEDLVVMERGLPNGDPKLVAMKKEALAICLEGIPSGALLKPSEQKGFYCGKLVPVPVHLLLPTIVEKMNEAGLAVFKSPSITISRLAKKDMSGFALSPQQGYVLYLCEKPARALDLINAGAMPEGQMIKALYLLMLIGAIEASPDAGQPPRLSFLTGSIEMEQQSVAIQSSAIENLVSAFQTPGMNPWKILGLREGAVIASVSQAHDALMARLDKNNLHPEVYKKYSKDITYLQAKCAEACLLIQGSFLESKRLEQAAMGAGESEAKRLEQAKTGRQEARETQHKEAARLFRYAQELFGQEQFYECTQYLKLALFYDPGNAGCYHLLGRAMASASDARGKHAAEKAFLQAVHLDPWEIAYLIDLASFYLDAGLLARCETYVEAAQKINPKDQRVKELAASLREKK